MFTDVWKMCIKKFDAECRGYQVSRTYCHVSFCYSGVLMFDMKIFVNVARLEIGQLFTHGMRLGASV